MPSRTRTVVGLVVGLILAAGGGLGVRAIADSPKKNVPPPGTERAVADANFRVVAVRGNARALALSGAWRPLQKDDVVPRPSGVDVGPGDTLVSLTSSDITLNASHGARATFNASGMPLRVYVDRGRVWVQSARDTVDAVVERHQTTISGRSFGLWVRDGKLLVSAIAREITVRRGDRQNTYSPGTEVVIGSDGVRTRSLPTELSLDLDNARKDGGRWTVEGRTSPAAVVLGLVAGQYQELTVSSEGRFNASLAEQVPAQRELIAFDSAGREAQVGQRSQPLEAKAGRRRAADDEAPEPEPVETTAPQLERTRPLEEQRAAQNAAQPKANPGRRPGAQPKAAGKAEKADEGEDAISLDEPEEPAPSGHRSQKIKIESDVPRATPTEKKSEATPPKKDEDELELEW